VISDNATKQRILSAFGFLQSCDEQLLGRFLQRAAIARLDPGQIVCHQGHECSHLALLLDGTARVYKLGESGREITLYRISPGESCILTASCILSHLPFPAIAVCEEPVEAVVVPAADIRAWLAESPEWRDYVFSLVAHRMGDIISLVEEVVFQRMDQRIAQYLLQHAKPPQQRIEITHQAIASDLGTSREVVSRILKDFESKELIRASRGSLELLDVALLEERTWET
jgi:CRP/FNR family transcriptional regulator